GGLFEKMKDAIAIRSENHGLAVRGPGKRKIPTLDEAQLAQRGEPAAGAVNLRDIDDRRFGPAEIAQVFSIGGDAGADLAVRAAGQPLRLAYRAIPLGVEAHSPEVGIILVGRQRG